MKKSILIGALAVLMLVAFTACENNAPTTPLYGKVVESIKPVSYPEIVVDEDENVMSKYTAADFTFEVVFDDDSTQQYNGYELALDPTAIKFSNDSAQVSIKYGPNNGKSFNVVVPYYTAKLTGFDVSGAKTTTLAPKASTTISCDGFKYVYTYDVNGTEKSISVATDDKFTTYAGAEFGLPMTVVSGSNTIMWDRIEEGAQYTFKMSDTWIQRNSSFKFKSVDEFDVIGTWTLTIKTPDPVVASDIVVKQAEKNEVFVTDTFDAVAYTMSFTYGDSTVNLSSDGSNSTSELYCENYDDAFEFEKVGAVSNAPVIVAKNKTTGALVKGTLNLNVITDYPKAITVTKNDEAIKADNKKFIADGSVVDPKYFNFEIKSWVKGNTASVDNPTASKELSSSLFTGLTVIKKGTTETTIDVKFKYSEAGTQTEEIKLTGMAIDK